MANADSTRRSLEQIWARAWAREAARVARDRAVFRANSRREGMGTMMLGTASLALSIVMLIVTIQGLFGVVNEPWTVRRVVMVEKQPRQVLERIDPVTGLYSYDVVYVEAGYLGVPTENTGLLGVLSLIFGGIGLVISIKARRVSWLCAAGFCLTFTMMLLGMAAIFLRIGP